MDYVEKLVDPKDLPNLVEDALDYAHVRIYLKKRYIFENFSAMVWSLERQKTKIEVMFARMLRLLYCLHLFHANYLNKE